MAEMLHGRVVGLNLMQNKYYVRVQHPDGGPDRFIPAAISTQEVLNAMPFVKQSPDIAELFGQCHDIYIASTSCSFGDFQHPQSFLSHRNMFDTPGALHVVDARGNRPTLSDGPIELAAWFIFFYDGSGQVLGINEKLEIAWYIHDHQRIIIMPLTLREVFRQMTQTFKQYPWFHAFKSIELAGVSSAIARIP